MALNVPHTGENIALEALVNKTAPQTLLLHLFISNTTPADTDTLATYTEATFPGYASVSLTPATWGAASGGTITYGSQITFTCTGTSTDNVYGYYVNQTTSTTLVWSERDAAAPFAVRNNGDAIKITPTISAN
jgi:hypothetical protein